MVAVFANCLSRARTHHLRYRRTDQGFHFCRDVAAANIAAMDRADGQVLNISTNKAVSVKELYAQMAALWGTTDPAKTGPPREGDIQHSILDNKKACRELGWEPQWSLEEGLGMLKKAVAK